MIITIIHQINYFFVNKIKAIVIDDEPGAISSLEFILNLYKDDIELLGNAREIETGWSLIHRVKPDLVFLDVEMPRGSGYDLLQRFPFRTFEVVIVSAYNAIPQKLAAHKPLRYINKPIDPTEIKKVIDAFRQKKISAKKK